MKNWSIIGKSTLMKNLQAKKTEPIHDAILFGKGRFPDLIGYAAGYRLINLLYKKKSFTFRETFTIKEDEVMKRSGFLILIAFSPSAWFNE